MSLPVRVGTLLVAFLAVVGGAIFVVIHFLLAGPPTVDFSAGVTPNSGQVVNVVLQEDAQNTVSNTPDWVSYFIQDPKTKKWVHTTLFKVPAGSRINVTLYGYDGCTPLRNPFWGKVTGTAGNVEYIDGKATPVLDSWGSCSVAHTFSIPGIGLNVPVASPTSLADNNNLCGVSPCTSGPHTTVTFSFNSPSTPGDYFWQCRVPCGLGYLDGFGGPMQTIGFMTGQMEVAS
ncbi:MAG TPA: hypothetical protein VNF47_26095 [Streptosporangiaceae bacterium]|nr:hypothetical protein [Streptosporangiaceae bacterium]